MGIGNYNHESIHDQKSIFLPMFCRLSIKDVKLNTVPIAAADPSSPRVSCMGQVKRNNRVTGFPATGFPIIPAAAAHHHHKHIKPRKVQFSTKNLLPNPTTTTAAAAAAAPRKSGSRSCRSNREMCVRDSRRSVAKTDYDHHDGDRDCVKVVIDISKMDPPLPVVKRAAPPGNSRDEVNIWKRRFDGAKSMQIEPIHLPGKRLQPPPPTTV